MSRNDRFFNLYHHAFMRVAVAIPEVRVADPAYNAQQTITLMKQAAERKAVHVLFPELGLSAYSCEDLFHQRALLDGCLDGLVDILNASTQIPVIAMIGLPLQIDSLLFNCAAVLSRGRLLGVIPKTYLPNYREFYELRQFAPADCARRRTIELAGQRDVPFGNRLLFQLDDQPHDTFYVEICEDLWVPIPPSSLAALAGATILFNLSASNITIGKEDYRRQLVANQSARCLAAYVYASAGFGESTTDLAWDGHGMIYENGTPVAESPRFAYGPQFITADLDLDRLVQDRMRQNSFAQAIHQHQDALKDFHLVRVAAKLPDTGRLLLNRQYERFPYVPSDPQRRDDRCREVYEIQVQGLVKRLQAARAPKVVIGVSGGLDSTQALLVCVKAMDVMGHSRRQILAYTLPGFATSRRTRDQAWQLMKAVGCTAREMDIRSSCEQMLKAIGHPSARGERVYDTTFENVQAGERTSFLFRVANQEKGIVVGTSDLSELALGWCTYGVGDQMAHYDVNASVPKTLIQFLIRWVASSGALGPDLRPVLEEILSTDISPELVPGTPTEQPGQRSEEIIGPYALQDFHLYYTLRFGYSPPKTAFLAYCAWHDKATGQWPTIPEDQRREFTIGEIKRWLKVFLQRFFQDSQFKRSALPNAPKVGSGGSLSPRGDYRAPSDSEANAWLTQLDRIPDEESE